MLRGYIEEDDVIDQSIFDINSIRDFLRNVEDPNGLLSEEIIDELGRIESFDLSFIKSPSWDSNLHPQLKFIWIKEVSLVISPEKPGKDAYSNDDRVKEIQEKLKLDSLTKEQRDELSKDLYKLKLSILKLGEYRHAEKKVILYVNNIRDCVFDEKDFVHLLYIVYVHEMMHVYFDFNRNPDDTFDYIPEIEEPLAEYGMLMTFEAMRWDYTLNMAKEYVAIKQVCPPICYYGYGAFLFSIKDKSLPNLVKYYKSELGDIQYAHKVFLSGYPSEGQCYEYLEYLKSL